MSLIDEALKRARQEAARQDAAQRYAYPANPVQVPMRDRSRSSLLVGLLAGLLIGVVAIAGTLWVTRARSGPEVAAVAVPTPAAVGTSAAAPVPVIEEISPTPPATIPVLPSPAAEPVTIPAPTSAAAPPVPAPPRIEPVEAQPRPAAPAEPRPAPAIAAPAPAPPPLVVPPATAEDAAPAPTHAAPDGTPAGLDGRTFVRELQVPGGGTLELRGIASGAQPAALINGRVLARGEVIEGFTVVGVESRRVELKGYGATVYLSLDQDQ